MIEQVPFYVRRLLITTLSASGCLVGSNAARDPALASPALTQARRSCGVQARDLDPHLTSPGVIQQVAPLYQLMHTHGESQHRLIGAQLCIPALPGLTTAWLERTLRCHGALVSLGRLSSSSDDPYFLPDGWVEIEARSEGGCLMVTLRGESPEQDRRILARATSFARRATEDH